MAIVKILKERDFNQDSDEHIYPVTVMDAIYDLNNNPLIDIVEDLRDADIRQSQNWESAFRSISNLENRNIELSEDQTALQNDYDEFKIVYGNNINSINQNIQNISNTAFKIVGAVKHGAESRTELPLICTNLFATSNKCVLGNDVTDYLEENSILILSNPGQYTVGEQVFTVDSIGLIFYKDNTANFIDLGITVLPTPPESGKYLLLSVNGTISWTDANS